MTDETDRFIMRQTAVMDQFRAAVAEWATAPPDSMIPLHFAITAVTGTLDYMDDLLAAWKLDRAGRPKTEGE